MDGPCMNFVSSVPVQLGGKDWRSGPAGGLELVRMSYFRQLLHEDSGSQQPCKGTE